MEALLGLVMARIERSLLESRSGEKVQIHQEDVDGKHDEVNIFLPRQGEPLPASSGWPRPFRFPGSRRGTRHVLEDLPEEGRGCSC